MNIKSKINKSISSFSEYLLYQKGLSQNTVDSYKSDLTKLSNYLQNQDLSKTNIDNFFIDMSEFNYSSSTKKRMHSSIKNFLKYINENEDYESIDISDIKLKSSKKLPEVLSITDIENMINFYSTPGSILNLLDYANENDVDLTKISLKDFIKKIITEKKYKKNHSII